MKKFFRNFKSSFVVFGLIFIALGIALLIVPKLVSTVSGYVIGALLVIFGVYGIIAYFSASIAKATAKEAEKNGNPNAVVSENSKQTARSSLLLAYAMIIFGIGLYFLFNVSVVADSLKFIVGLVLLIDAFLKFQKSIELMKANYKIWWLPLIFSIMTLAFGVMEFTLKLEPESSAIFVGIAFIFIGLTDIWIATRYNKYITYAEPEPAPVPVYQQPVYQAPVYQAPVYQAPVQQPAAAPVNNESTGTENKG